MSALRRGAWIVTTTVCALLGLSLMTGIGAQSQAPAVQSLAEREGGSLRERQWALDRLNLPAAWKESRGKGVTVAVLDTGVDERHPDLKGKVLFGPDLTGGSETRGRHGTSMAGIIAGNATGVSGVSPEATILSVRVMPDAGERRPIRNDALARGIRYAADHGAQVISMSLGSGRDAYTGNEAEEEAIEYAREQGAILIASAGNDGDEANRRNYPAAYSDVIAVGAADRRGRPARFSNRRDYVDLIAPGVQIVSPEGGAGYSAADGTSSAAAHVAGIAALIRARYPGLDPDQVRLALRAGDNGGDDRPGYGSGLVDAAEAMRAASGFAGEIAPTLQADDPGQQVTGGASSSSVDRWWAGLLLVVIAIACAVVSLRLSHRPAE